MPSNSSKKRQQKPMPTSVIPLNTMNGSINGTNTLLSVLPVLRIVLKNTTKPSVASSSPPTANNYSVLFSRVFPRKIFRIAPISNRQKFFLYWLTSCAALSAGSRCRRFTASLPVLYYRALSPRPVRHICDMLHKAAKDAAPPVTRSMRT